MPSLPGSSLPGFVDAHTHLLAVAAGERIRDDNASYYRSLASRGTTPTDVIHGFDAGVNLPVAFGRALEQAAAVGLVEIHEAGMQHWEYWEALQRLRDTEILPVRVRIFVASGVADLRRMDHTSDPWLAVSGVKFYADGSLCTRTCAVDSAFADTADKGLLFLDAHTLAQRAEPFANDGWTIATHAIGDRAINAVLDAYEMIYGGDCAVHAPRIEHAQLLTSSIVDRMAGLGVTACVQPCFGSSDWDHVIAAVPTLIDTAYRYQVLVDHGVNVIAGSDYPIEPLSPLENLQRLVTGHNTQAPVMTMSDAISIMTSVAAGVTHLDGSLDDIDPELISTVRVLGTEPAC